MSSASPTYPPSNTHRWLKLSRFPSWQNVSISLAIAKTVTSNREKCLNLNLSRFRFEIVLCWLSGANSETTNPATETFLAAVSLVAYIFTQLSDKHPTESRVLLGLTIFLVGAEFYAPLKRKATDWREHRSDEAVARNAFAKFREFVHRFGEFIDSRRNDTLHAIVLHEIVQRRADANAGFKLPNMDTWHSW